VRSLRIIGGNGEQPFLYDSARLIVLAVDNVVAISYVSTE
jgi:hypothetical protein